MLFLLLDSRVKTVEHYTKVTREIINSVGKTDRFIRKIILIFRRSESREILN